MLESEFNSGISRLKKAFGDKPFNDERTRLLWKRFGRDDPGVFQDAVDYMILSYRQPPLVNDFGHAIGKVREKRRRFDALKEAREAAEFFERDWEDEDAKWVFAGINKMLAGKLDDKEREECKELVAASFPLDPNDPW